MDPTIRRKQAVVIGTSNSLMREGWVNQTRETAKSAGWDLSNRSIGGSSSMLAAYLVATDDEVRRADCIMVDCFINDQLFIDEKQATLEHVLGHYGSMVQSLGAMDAVERLLVLMFPQQNVNHSLFDELCLFFDRVGVRYVDFRERVRAWSDGTGGLRSAYSDPFHFTPAIQRRIGSAALAELARSPSAPQNVARYRRWLHGLRPLGLMSLEISAAVTERRELGTSVLRASALRFHHGDRFTLSGAAYLVGAHIWATREAGVITVRGVKRDVRVHFRRDYAGLFIFDTIFDPLPLAPVALVELRNDRTVPFQRMRGQQSSIYEDAGTSVDIVALIGAARPSAELGRDIRNGKPARPGWRAVLSGLRLSFRRVPG